MAKEADVVAYIEANPWMQPFFPEFGVGPALLVHIALTRIRARELLQDASVPSADPKAEGGSAC
jgi:hypothetical protein